MALQSQWNISDYSVTPIAQTPSPIILPSEAIVAIRLTAAADQNVVFADYTGANAVLASAIFNSLSGARWLQIMTELAPSLAAERAGIKAVPSG